jgi:GT2 family glycosyltransferase
VQVSIVIVNYNVKHFADLTISSVLGSASGVDYELIVVDNNSSDGSVEYLKSKYPGIRIIANDSNQGFSVANNQGIKEAKGEYVLLLNPDTVIAEDTLEKCIRFMEAHEDAGAIGVRMVDGAGKFLPESKRAFPGPAVAFYKAFGLSALFPKSKLFGKYHMGHLPETENHVVDVLAGAFMFIRKSALEKTGLLDEKFFMYGEDIDLSYRIKQAGYNNYYLADTPIIHFKGESTKKGTLNYVQMFYNAMKIFAEKHFAGRNKGLFILLINLAIYFRATVAILTGWLRRGKTLIIDLAILFLSMYLVKEYWEYYIRYIDGGTYPLRYIYINIPIYLALWTLALYLSGAYDRNANATRIIRGMAWGTLAIAAIYGFFPDSLRFSRGMIVAGAGLSTALLIGFRYSMHFIRTGNFRYGIDTMKRILLVGNADEAEHMVSFLKVSGLDRNVLGYCGEDNAPTRLQKLAERSELAQILHAYHPGEVIFGLSSVRAGEMMQVMMLHPGRYAYMMLGKGCEAVLGSQSKNSAGDRYEHDEYPIATPYNRRLKRTLDFSLAIALLVTLPIHLILIPQKGKFLTNLLHVLGGKKTWVGLGGAPDDRTNLLQVKSGVIDKCMIVEEREGTAVNCKVINRMYAREYNVSSDLRIVLKGYRLLGK